MAVVPIVAVAAHADILSNAVGQAQDYSLLSDPRLQRVRAIQLRNQYVVALKWFRQAETGGTLGERLRASCEATGLVRDYNAMAGAAPPLELQALRLPRSLPLPP